MMSSVTSGTMKSYHLALLPMTLPSQSLSSTLVRRELRYISDTAMMSGSHCRHRFVHKLKIYMYIAILLRLLPKINPIISSRSKLTVKLK